MRPHNGRPSARWPRARRVKRHYTWIIGAPVLPRLTRAADNAPAARTGLGRGGEHPERGGEGAGDVAPRERQMRPDENTASSPVTRTQTFAEVIMLSRCRARRGHSAGVGPERRRRGAGCSGVWGTDRTVISPAEGGEGRDGSARRLPPSSVLAPLSSVFRARCQCQQTKRPRAEQVPHLPRHVTLGGESRVEENHVGLERESRVEESHVGLGGDSRVEESQVGLGGESPRTETPDAAHQLAGLGKTAPPEHRRAGWLQVVINRAPGHPSPTTDAAAASGEGAGRGGEGGSVDGDGVPASRAVHPYLPAGDRENLTKTPEPE